VAVSRLLLGYPCDPTALTLRESHSARNHEENQSVALMKPHLKWLSKG
jgi:hypothetical protein